MFHRAPKLAVHFLIGTLVLAVTGTAGWLAYDNLPVGVSLDLKDGQTEVPLDHKLSLTFTRPAGAGAVAAAFSLSPTLQGRLDRSSDGKVFTFQPDTPWQDLTVYTVRLQSFEEAGHSYPARAWTFKATIVPRVTAVTTDAGAAVHDGEDLKLGTPLKLVFNAAMDQSTVAISLNRKPAALAWQAGGTATLVPTAGIPFGPLQLDLQEGAQDLQKHAAKPWKLALNLVFKIDLKTTPLHFPALVQVPNDAGARDQAGLTAADMVFEYLTEGGITRLTALFSKVPDTVGPVRSGRLIAFGLTRHYHGQLFLSGLSDGSMARLNADPVPTAFDYAGAGYYRAATHAAPDNLYIRGASIAADLRGSGDATQLKPGVLTLAGDPAATIAVPEHASTYAYDPATGTYLKSEEGHRYGDTLTGQPLRIQMVVVMRTTATQTSYVEDVNGLKGLDFNLESGGRADFYYLGKHTGGTWSAPNRSSAFVFKTDTGAALTLPNGLVWIDVVTG